MSVNFPKLWDMGWLIYTIHTDQLKWITLVTLLQCEGVLWKLWSFIHINATLHQWAGPNTFEDQAYPTWWHPSSTMHSAALKKGSDYAKHGPWRSHCVTDLAFTCQDRVRRPAGCVGGVTWVWGSRIYSKTFFVLARSSMLFTSAFTGVYVMADVCVSLLWYDSISINGAHLGFWIWIYCVISTLQKKCVIF